MSTSSMCRAPRQAAVLATIGSLHVGAFLLVVAGLGPRSDWLEPTPPPYLYELPKSPPPSFIAPGQPEPVDYSLPHLPVPSVPIPLFEEESQTSRVQADSPTEDVSGEGPGVPVPVVRAPSLRHRDGRLALLVDSCYPPASRRLGEEGRVIVRIEVDATGRTSVWNVAVGSGSARLDAAVACVIRRLDFNPGRRDGAAVAASVLLPIVFRLD